MKIYIFRKLAIALILSALAAPVLSQGPPPEPPKFLQGLSIGGGLGSSWIHGDLAGYQSIPHSDAGDFFQFGWNLHIEREMYEGIGLKLHFDRGRLGGGRAPGDQSPVVTFKTKFSHLSLRANYNAFKAFFVERGDQKRYFIYPEIGVGVIFWRSLSNWTGDDERVRDYVGYTVTDENPPTQRYTVKGKDKPATAITVPVGFTAGYQINYKTDVTLSYSFTNVFSDQLDTWNRDWSAQDKYSYVSVGIRYNFGRTKDDIPEKKKKDRRRKKDDDDDEKDQSFSTEKEEGVTPNKVDMNSPITARHSRPLNFDSDGTTIDEIKLKMFELQMKLFELQYLNQKAQKP